VRTLSLVMLFVAGVAIADDKPKCDDATVRAHEDAGIKAVAEGNYAVALAELEAVLACKPADQPTARRTYLAACKSHKFARAKQLFDKLKDQSASIVQICVAEGFDPRK
jgi:hypothetical protein